MPPQSWLKLWLKSLPVNLAFAVVLGWGLPLLLEALGALSPQEHDGIPRTAMIALVLFPLAAILSSRRQAARLEDYSVTLGPKAITAHIHGRDDVTIAYTDILELVDTRFMGLFVNTGNPSKRIFVLPGLERGDELRAQLERITPIKKGGFLK
jgi:hypothetical protein